MDKDSVGSLAHMVTAELTTAFAMWGDKRGLPLIHWIFNLSHDESRELFVATPTSIYDDDECCVQAALWAAALGLMPPALVMTFVRPSTTKGNARARYAGKSRV